MNIYFACPVNSARGDESVYQAMVDTLIADGHDVPTAIISRPEVVEMEKTADPQEIYSISVQRIERCDAMIAEVSMPSLGVGYEIAYALSLGKPVFCCYREGVDISKMIIGNDHPGILVSSYHDTDMMIGLVRSFIHTKMSH